MGITTKFYIMFKNPFSFDGRIRRTEYGLSLIIAAAGRVFVAMLLAGAIQNEGFVAVNLLIQIPFIWFFWAQGAKRCHDLGMSGWYQLIPFFPLYMIFAAGEADTNKYGENPKVVSENF
jgi:uncharacterized membrane protein YhaH (DUF805 family)